MSCMKGFVRLTWVVLPMKTLPVLFLPVHYSPSRIGLDRFIWKEGKNEWDRVPQINSVYYFFIFYCFQVHAFLSYVLLLFLSAAYLFWVSLNYESVYFQGSSNTLVTKLEETTHWKRTLGMTEGKQRRGCRECDC